MILAASWLRTALSALMTATGTVGSVRAGAAEESFAAFPEAEGAWLPCREVPAGTAWRARLVAAALGGLERLAGMGGLGEAAGLDLEVVGFEGRWV